MYEGGSINIVITLRHRHIAVNGLSADEEDVLFDKLDAIFGSALMMQVSPLEIWVPELDPEEVWRAVEAVVVGMDVGYSPKEETT